MNDELRVKNNELGGKMKYRYRTDEEMKDSGVEWLDVIPKSWTRNKLKRELKFSVGSTPSTSNRSFFEGENIWVTIGDLNGKYCSESKTKLTEEALRSANMKKVPKGSLLYSFKLSVGQVAFTEKDLYTNEAIASFYPNNNSNLDFWYYALGNYLIENSNENIYGAKLLNQELINNANIFVQSEEEQKKIAKFLDKKSAEFDSIISKKETLIEKLEEAKKSLISEVVTGKVKVVKTNDGYELVERKKEEMKDSGVEWLGDIPKEWDIKKVKHVLSEPLKYGANESAELDDRSLPRYIRITDFAENGKLKDETFKSLTIDKASGYYLNEGDILFARSGATVGKTFLFKNYKGKACFAGYLIKASVNKQIINPEFLYNFTKSKGYENWKNSIFMQATIQNIGADKYKELKFTLPNKNEQEIICEFIEDKNIKYNKFFNKINKQIEKLKEAKQSLISEAVTGKIEILD